MQGTGIASTGMEHRRGSRMIAHGAGNNVVNANFGSWSKKDDGSADNGRETACMMQEAAAAAAAAAVKACRGPAATHLLVQKHLCDDDSAANDQREKANVMSN